MPRKPFNVATNVADPMIPRISESLRLRGDVAATKQHFDGVYQALDKPEFNAHAIHGAAPMVAPTLRYGVDHFAPLPTSVDELFGPKTGGGLNPLGWPPYARHSTLFGE
jgi:hypothetical protein